MTLWTELLRAAVLVAAVVLFGTTAWWIFQALASPDGGSWLRVGLAVLACAGVAGAFAWMARDAEEPVASTPEPPADDDAASVR